MPRRIRNPLYQAMLLCLLSGCTVGPDFEKPAAWFPDEWFSSGTEEPTVASVPVSEPLNPDWWALFNDAELTALEKRVVSANLDIQAATMRVAESRAQRRIAGASELPGANADASYARELPSAKGAISLIGGGGKGDGGSNAIPLTAFTFPSFNLWQYGLDSSWELDLWGRVRRSVESADAALEASAAARRGTLVSVLAEVARDYLALRGTQTELKITQENLALDRDNLRLTRERADAGLATQLDAANAAAALARTGALIPQLEQQQAQYINQLGFLLGETPGALSAELMTAQAVPPVPPRVPVGLPSELARRRPDILQAEAALHAQTAQVGVARANFYPSVNLTGNFDLQALQTKDLGNWAARTYGIGPSLSLPIFQGGELRGTLKLTKAEAQEAAIAYQRTVLNAWQEIANALIAYEAEQRRGVQLAEAVVQNKRALALARQRYKQGLVDFLQVLATQENLLTAQQQQADSVTTLALDLVSLYKALGGGWENTFPVESEGLHEKGPGDKMP